MGIRDLGKAVRLVVLMRSIGLKLATASVAFLLGWCVFYRVFASMDGLGGLVKSYFAGLFISICIVMGMLGVIYLAFASVLLEPNKSTGLRVGEETLKRSVLRAYIFGALPAVKFSAVIVCFDGARYFPQDITSVLLFMFTYAIVIYLFRDLSISDVKQLEVEFRKR